jgi:hypothetical protein
MRMNVFAAGLILRHTVGIVTSSHDAHEFPMAKIFISYRRADTKKDAGRIYDRLIAEFGKDNVFKDVDTIPIGKDFREVLTDWVSRSDVMLVLIGTQWLTLNEADGTPRIHNPSDFVHYEVNLGLRSSTVSVIPVIIAPASPPASTELPEALRELAYLNAAFVRDDPDFHRDISRLIESLKAIPSNTVISGTSHKPQKSWWERLTEGQGIVIAAVVAGLFTLLAAWIALNGNNPPASTPEPTTIAQAETTEPSAPTEAPSDTHTATLSVTEVEATIRAEMAAIQAEAQRNNEATQTAIAEADRLANEATTIAQTQTAESWTDTPTPDLRATAGARLTQDAQSTQAILISLNSTMQAVAQRAFLSIAQGGVNSNAEWTPYIQEFNGVEMVLVLIWVVTMVRATNSLPMKFVLMSLSGLTVLKSHKSNFGVSMVLQSIHLLIEAIIDLSKISHGLRLVISVSCEMLDSQPRLNGNMRRGVLMNWFIHGGMNGMRTTLSGIAVHRKAQRMSVVFRQGCHGLVP